MTDYFATTVGDFHFVGDSCSQCKKTANVAHCPGWFCQCGAYQVLPFYGGQIPHETPDIGPTASDIQTAIKQAKQINPKKFAWIDDYLLGTNDTPEEALTLRQALGLEDQEYPLGYMRGRGAA